MNVTKHVLKGRQLHKEGYPRMVPAEQGEYLEASEHERIAENNGFIVDLQADRLLEQILHRDNMNNAYFSVKANKGVGGVDRMSVDELLPYLKENKDTLLSELWLGKYKPQPVRRVEIPKEEKGKVRKLGIPTVVDRMVQQAIAQVLTPMEEIAFIHEANTELRKAELFGKVRSGQVRFLLGFTQKMGAGTNVQDRLIALHHLDVPWRPSDIEQQEGRILRQGNLNPKVKILRYVTEGTFDSYSW